MRQGKCVRYRTDRARKRHYLFARMSQQPDDVATLLMMARMEIRDLKREAAALPPEEAAGLMEKLEQLAAESCRLARAAAQKIREH